MNNSQTDATAASVNQRNLQEYLTQFATLENGVVQTHRSPLYAISKQKPTLIKRNANDIYYRSESRNDEFDLRDSKEALSNLFKGSYTNTDGTVALAKSPKNKSRTINTADATAVPKLRGIPTQTIPPGTAA